MVAVPLARKKPVVGPDADLLGRRAVVAAAVTVSPWVWLRLAMTTPNPLQDRCAHAGTAAPRRGS